MRQINYCLLKFTLAGSGKSCITLVDRHPASSRTDASYIHEEDTHYLPSRPTVNFCPAYFVPVFFPFVSEGFSISDVQQVSLAVKKSE
jgi:hypothetical protein